MAGNHTKPQFCNSSGNHRSPTNSRLEIGDRNVAATGQADQRAALK